MKLAARLALFAALVLLMGLGVSSPTIAQTTVTYIHTDALGSVVAESDANGNVIKRYDYEPYGAVVGGQVTDGPGYTGHVSDSATGLSYMQQRYMDPQLGVFLSLDPVTAYEQPVGQFNRYRYANGNPYKFTDPDGRDMNVPPASRQAVSGYVAKNASGSFEISDNGKMKMTSRDGGQGQRSDYLRDKLSGVIDSSRTMHVQVLSVYVNPVTFVPVDVDSMAGGGLTQVLPNGDVNVVISGNSNNSLRTESGGALIDGPAEVFAHEVVAHAAPAILGSDTGNGVMNENKFQREVSGLDQRAPEPNHRE